MRQMFWLSLILIGSGILTTIGLINSKPEYIFGGMLGGFMVSFIYCMYADTFDSEKEQKRLDKENKYRKDGKCSNCETWYSFEVTKGVCMMEFLQDKKCKNCSCELRVNEQQNPNEVKQE